MGTVSGEIVGSNLNVSHFFCNIKIATESESNEALINKQIFNYGHKNLQAILHLQFLKIQHIVLMSVWKKNDYELR